MDDFSQSQSDLINQVRNNIPAGYTLKQFKYPNAPFNEPTNKPWLRFTSIPEPKSNVEAGGGYKRTYGIFVIDCFYPKGEGSKKQLSDLKYLQSLFENQTVGFTKCQEAYPQIVGEDGDWYNAQLNINFYFEGN